MPKGKHFALYPISGVQVAYYQQTRKRGLYFLNRRNILTPKWGLRKLWENPSPIPDGSGKSFDTDVNAAWPTFPLNRHHRFYAKNEARYLVPPSRAHDCKIREYLLNVLEPSYNGKKTYSGIGRPDVTSIPTHHYVELLRSHGGSNTSISTGMYSTSTTMGIGVLGENEEVLFEDEISQAEGDLYDETEHYRPNHIEAIMKAEDEDFYGLLKGASLERGRIKRLFAIIKESDAWRGQMDSRIAAKSPFPFVDERAQIMKNLTIADCCYARSNHRIKSRRHPIWSQRQYHNRMNQDKYKMRKRILKEEAQLRLWNQAYNMPGDKPSGPSPSYDDFE